MNVYDLKTSWLSKLIELKAGSNKKRKQLLKEAQPDGLLRVLYQIARNIYYTYVPVTLKDKTRLLRFRKELMCLARSNTTAERRRKLLLKYERHGGRELLTALLTPFIRALASTKI
ncbi:MAG: hypothetical protein GY696_34790 [Gammaproteobacteria bacterium]|nr:hypothetical protein [Gammaproteobacteria bacterium]